MYVAITSAITKMLNELASLPSYFGVCSHDLYNILAGYNGVCIIPLFYWPHIVCLFALVCFDGW